MTITDLAGPVGTAAFIVCCVTCFILILDLILND